MIDFIIFVGLKNFHRKYEAVVEYANAKLNPQQFLLLSSFLVGISAAMAAIILKFVVHYLHQLITYNPKLGNYSYLYLFFPLVGIVVTVFIVRRFFNKNLPKGNALIIHAIHKKNGIIDSFHMYAHLITSAITVGLGGSVGLESPMVITGSAIGSNYARTYQISYADRLLLIASGTAAGIGAAFNAPIAGVLFAFEVLIANATVSAFIPIIIASASGAILAKIFFNENILLNFKLKEVFNYKNIPFYLILAVICGAVSVIYAKLFSITDEYYKNLRLNAYWKAVLGGLLIAGLCLFLPPLFGEGYNSIKDLADMHPEKLIERSIMKDYINGPGTMFIFLVLVFIFKAFAVGITLGTGGNGGNFAPSLFVGAFVGFAFSNALVLIGFTNIPHDNFGLVAMAGILSGLFHAPLTGIFLIAEITGGYELFIPLMLVSAISYLISRYFDKYTIDTKKLAAQGLFRKQSVDDITLSALNMHDIMETHYPIVNEDLPLKDFIEKIVDEEEIIFAVVNAKNKLCGIVNIEQIKRYMIEPDLQKENFVKNVMGQPAALLLEGESMNAIVKKFESTNAWILPVVDVNLVYKGFIMRNRIFEHYRKKVALMRSVKQNMN